jgi:ATP-dependent DNA helicase RecQ
VERALDSAYGVLLSGDEESAITEWFICSALPTRQEVVAVLEMLEREPNGLSVPELLTIDVVGGGSMSVAVEAPE